jgi:hypothetical protein
VTSDDAAAVAVAGAAAVSSPPSAALSGVGSADVVKGWFAAP